MVLEISEKEAHGEECARQSERTSKTPSGHPRLGWSLVLCIYEKKTKKKEYTHLGLSRSLDSVGKMGINPKEILGFNLSLVQPGHEILRGI